MKKAFLSVLCCSLIIAISAQDVIKKHSVSGGLLGAVNFTLKPVGQVVYGLIFHWGAAFHLNHR